jgi:hypothetical protein
LLSVSVVLLAIRSVGNGTYKNFLAALDLLQEPSLSQKILSEGITCWIVDYIFYSSIQMIRVSLHFIPFPSRPIIPRNVSFSLLRHVLCRISHARQYRRYHHPQWFSLQPPTNSSRKQAKDCTRGTSSTQPSRCKALLHRKS